MESFDVLMIGHFAKDKVIVDGKEVTQSGGGVYFGSMVLNRMGLKVAVATRLHPEDFPRLDEMRQTGIRVFAAPAPQTSGIANYYQSSDMERRTCKLIGFAGTMSLDDVPEMDVSLIMVTGIIAGEVDLPTLKVLSTLAPVALDVQGFVRVPEDDDLVFKPWDDLEEGLACVTYLKVDRAEAEHLTGETDLQRAARKLSKYGPKEIMLTQSSGPVVYAGGEFYQAAFTARSLAGRTGRGDTCFSAYLGKRFTAGPEEAVRWAAAVTSAKMETPGPWQGNIIKTE